jgi:outer membrane protein TolC
MLDIELNLAKLRNGFKKLSRKNPDRLRVPHLRMISLKNYKRHNMNLVAKQLRVLEKEYSSKITWTKYLPTVSVNARYTNTNRHQPGLDDDYSTYGFKITVPLSINSMTDIESSRVSYLQSATELQDSRRTAHLEYDIVRKSIQIINRKIALAKKDEALYRRLYKRTKDLVKAGEKTHQDVETMHHSLEIKKLDRKIYAIDKQQQLLSLYIKVSH